MVGGLQHCTSQEAWSPCLESEGGPERGRRERGQTGPLGRGSKGSVQTPGRSQQQSILRLTPATSHLGTGQGVSTHLHGRGEHTPPPWRGHMGDTQRTCVHSGQGSMSRPGPPTRAQPPSGAALLLGRAAVLFVIQRGVRSGEDSAARQTDGPAFTSSHPAGHGTACRFPYDLHLPGAWGPRGPSSPCGTQAPASQEAGRRKRSWQRGRHGQGEAETDPARELRGVWTPRGAVRAARRPGRP